MPELPVPVRIQSSYLTVLRYVVTVVVAIAALMAVVSFFWDDLAEYLLDLWPQGVLSIGAFSAVSYVIAYFLLGVRSFEFSNDWVEIKRPWGQRIRVRRSGIIRFVERPGKGEGFHVLETTDGRTIRFVLHLGFTSSQQQRVEELTRGRAVEIPFFLR